MRDEMVSVAGENPWSDAPVRRRRDEIAFRAALGRHRRRYPRAPLCSTSFGGSTVPPLFGGGGGAPSGNIFIRSAGNIFTTLDGPVLATTVPDPPTVAVNDTLLMFISMNGFLFEAAANPGWTSSNFTPGDGAFENYSRLADGSASDTFNLPAGTLAVQAQTVAIGNLLGELGQLFVFQGGAINSASNANWDIFALNFGTGLADRANFAWFRHIRVQNTAVIPPAGTVGSNMPSRFTQIGANALSGQNTAGNQSRQLWYAWYFEYEAVTTALPAVNHDYTISIFGGNFTTYQRWRY